MSFKAYRICDNKYSDDLSGQGAKIYGGRWNSKGTPIVYTSCTKALAVLELLVHASIYLLPQNLVLITISIPDKVKINEYKIKELPDNWRTYPAPVQTQMLGDDWIKSKETLILKIPSVIIPSEYNFLLNPIHKDIKRIRIIKKEKFEFDKRLLNTLK
jgi:RES domain-containing protein